MSNPGGLTSPGSAVYDSQTMYVGDGTWDTKLNTFLLPNLQGLNFATMRYNGMGNRFSQEAQYQTLIEAHGILAAITFLFVVPFAILFLRFYTGPSRWAVRLHIWCQIFVLFMTTALFAVGVLAVGPTRSLTNPHHGIGVAIYVLILFQFFLGWFTYSREKRRKLTHAPVKAVLHRWVGRTTALLALAQIPLGLTLYGSPVWLFVLYTLVVAAWVLVYFVKSYQDERDRGMDYGTEHSWAYGEGSNVDRRRHGRFSTLAKTAAAGAGIAYLANRWRGRKDPPPGSHHSGSYLHQEKYSEASEVQERRKGGFLSKVLGVGALGGLGYFLGKRWGRRHDDASVDSASYTSYTTDDRIDGQGSPDARRPLNRPSASALSGSHPQVNMMTGAAAVPAAAALAGSHHRRNDSQISSGYDSDDDYSSASPSHKRRHHGIRDTIMGLGAVGLARNLFKNRRARKEDARIAELRRQDIEEERINRANSQRQRFTGDGYPRPGTHRQESLANTELTPIPGSGVALASGALASGAVAASGAAQANTPYQHPAYGSGVGPLTVDGQPIPVVPPPPRDPRPMPQSSGSELYTAPDGTPHHRHHAAAEAAGVGLAAGAAGLAADEMLHSRREHSESRREHSESRRASGSTANTPPISVKLNMRNDGRHVTLRRLTEEEAAADRARNRMRRQQQRQGGGSASDVSAAGPAAAEGNGRWRRNDPRPAADDTTAERQRLQASQTRLNANNPSGAPIPPPPPIPGSEAHSGSVTSPGPHDGTATDASTNYERNRRRRRAERAASGQRQRVEFD